MKWIDVKTALEANGKCSINDYIFDLTKSKDKAGKNRVYIGFYRVGVKDETLGDNCIEFSHVGFYSFNKFRYWLAQHQYIED